MQIKGYRTYASAVAIVLVQVLAILGFTEFTNAQITEAITVLLAVAAFIFRMLANKE